jgi:hypothetical protein
MKVSNTQLAAALVALGYDILPTTDYNAPEVIFDFHDYAEIERYDQRWRELSISGASVSTGPEDVNDPLPLLFRVARSRQWVLEQVVHGNHNEGLELPGETMVTDNLHLAICLVAKNQYLLKLDKAQRLFHFDKELAIWKLQFESPKPSDDFYYCRLYLRTLDKLVRKINSRNLTRQPNQPVIACEQ